MTTADQGANSKERCVPKAGYTQDGLRAKPCAPGFYKSDLGTSACMACATGLTTAAPGKTSIADCALAQPGFYLANGDAAECPANTFNPAPTSASSCTPCPSSLVTVPDTTGATKATDCVAVPGSFLDVKTGVVAPCPADTYKETYSRVAACTPW